MYLYLLATVRSNGIGLGNHYPQTINKIIFRAITSARKEHMACMLCIHQLRIEFDYCQQSKPQSHSKRTNENLETDTDPKNLSGRTSGARKILTK